MKRLVTIGVALAALLVSTALTAQEPSSGRSRKKKSAKEGSSRPFVPWTELEKVGQFQEWFEVYRIRPGVLAIYEPKHSQKTISYLITGRDRALLFDTGLGLADMGSLVAELTSLPVAVLNSHSHGDHIGGNHQFDKIYALENEFTRLNARGMTHEGAAPDAPPEERYRIRPFEITDLVGDKSRIDLGGRVLEVVATPGHAPDALCLIDREARLLLTGDTFYLGSVYAHLEHSNWKQYQRTTFRLASLARKVDFLLPGHLTTLVDSTFLRRLHLGMKSIAEGTARGRPEPERDAVVFIFRGFSILVRPRDARGVVASPPPGAPETPDG